ncbi:MAG TPA: bifunctional lysylphosphatidylglycerol synthetase/lysine--tRNA ligase LysX, partial [Propionibacteriaceae bacterium]|nr:bifunctional lysylphosphatidylglycerol synthetase/lysine--tRNA ligase LysX [Propionibacteriaceae bacterium]
VILAGLWLLRPAFPGHLQRGSWIRLAAALAIGATFTLMTTWVLLSIVHRDQGPQWRQLAGALARSFGDLDDRGGTIGIPPWIPELTSVMVSVTLVSAVVLFLRSAPYPTSWSGSREIAVRKLLAEYGDADSLGYFATRRDKSSIFSPDQKAAVTYRVISGVSLASGDPMGDPAAWPSAIREWKSEARYYGWLPAVVSASETGARAYADAGLTVMPMGDEAILAVDRFALANTSLSEVRHAARRAQRAGITVEINRQSQLSAAELAELTAAASQWRAGETDRGFSMALNRPADPADGQVIIVAARDGGRRLNGLLTFVPWGRRGVSLDVMRRSPQAPNGITELMVTEMMAAASSLGIRRVSLNFCMFRGVYADAARLGAGSLTRLNYSLLGVLDRFWQLERLYRANQKYDPYWRPRYLCYDGLISLPTIALATAMLEGFLPQFRLRPRAQLAALTAEELDQIRAIDTKSALTTSPATPRWSDQTRSRLDHLRALATNGHKPYPIGAVGPDTTLAALDLLLAEDPDCLSSLGNFRVAGRVQAIRDHGGVVFCTLTDAGKSAQVLLDATTIGDHDLRDFGRLIDIGDLVLLTGHLGRSRNGTSTLIARSWQLAAKSLHPIPFRGLTDQESRLRQRSLDLLVHPDGTQLLRDRSSVIQTLRRTLEAEGFLEVETPILHTVHGGATARPFRTYSNAYGIDLSLRIAPELHLKRLLVAGLGAVFEIGRNFRNEGADSTHNPEFTSLEAYLPYADYTTMRHLTERLIAAAATTVNGRPALPLPTGAAGDVDLVDITPPWPVVPVLEAVSNAAGAAITLDMDFDELVDLGRQHGVHIHDHMGPGAIIEELYAKLVEPGTIRPTFYTDFPTEKSPLAGPHRRCPGLVERWDLVINRMEVATAYSELTDPIEQRHRLAEQSLKAAAGDPEAMEIDEEFLAALEIGMPPTGGLGIGVDRLAMVITNRDIRTVLSFPFVRPKRLP